MPAQTWSLTDVSSRDDKPSFQLDLPGSGSVTKQRLQGGKQDGVDLVSVDNGMLQFALLPTRGMGIWQVTSGERRWGWDSPIRGPVHPQFVPLADPSGLGWLEGFDEMLVRCGMVSSGAPEFTDGGHVLYPLHGRIANLPAWQVQLAFDQDTGEISVTGVIEEVRFHFHKLRLTSKISTRLGEKSLRIEDRVENFSAVAAEAQMLYHVNFGSPLLEAGSKLVAPVEAIVPRNEHAAADIQSWDTYPAPRPGDEERVYFFKLLGDENGNTEVLLKNAQGNEGISLRFNTAELPCFTQWKNTPAAADGYVTGLEPGTNYPNPRSYEGQQGRVLKLATGESRTLRLELAWHLDPDQVRAAETAVTQLQADREPQVFDQPQQGWCAP